MNYFQDAVRYRIVSPSIAMSYFYINPTTGALYINRRLADNQLNDSYVVRKCFLFVCHSTLASCFSEVLFAKKNAVL